MIYSVFIQDLATRIYEVIKSVDCDITVVNLLE